MSRIKNRLSALIALAMIVLTILLLSSCSNEAHPNQDVLEENEDNLTEKEEINEDNNLYDYDLLYSYKNTSFSDTDKVKELVSQLQYAKELPIDLIEYKDRAFLRVDYRMSLTTGQKYKVNHTKRMADAVMLFALLDDLDAMQFNLVQGEYGYGGVSISRDEAEKVLDADIEALGKTKEIFLSEMPEKIASLQWDPDVMSVITYEHIMGLDE